MNETNADINDSAISPVVEPAASWIITHPKLYAASFPVYVLVMYLTGVSLLLYSSILFAFVWMGVGWLALFIVMSKPDLMQR